MKQLELEVITPAKAAYKGVVVSVSVPGIIGNFQILYNHAPIISSIDIGKIKIEEPQGKTLLFATSGGTVEVSNNKVIILAETFESAEEIDLKRAEDSKNRALKRLKAHEKGIDLDRAEAALKRAMNRLKISRN